MAFVVEKQLKLDFLGANWHDAYINFSLPGLRESLDQSLPTEDQLKSDPKKYTNDMVTYMQKHFLSGKGWDGSQLVDLIADDIYELPPIVFVEISKLLGGQPDPNS